MLNPAIIPKSEPLISVGIILPEDGTTQIHLQTPENNEYHIILNDQKYKINNSKHIEIKLQDDKLSLIFDNRIVPISNNELEISPSTDSSNEILPKSGILLKDVISGRGFHWKKRIDVYLPEKIIIKSFEKHLILINKIKLETYLMCVATSEMGAASPPALIEAQTIAARSWLLAAAEQKHKDLGLDACNDDCCQRYQGTTYLTKQSINGALNTYGEAIMHDHKICDARYSKSCGGMVEAFENIWEGTPISCLSALPDMETTPAISPDLSDESQFRDWIFNPPQAYCSPSIIAEDKLKQYLGSVDENGKYYRWQIKLKQNELAANINKYNQINADKILELIPVKRGASGRVTELKIIYSTKNDQQSEYLLKSEYKIRQSLHKSFLYSSAFTIERNVNENIPAYFALHGAGWGHGVGLCQIGALGMALSGISSEKIIAHYYPHSSQEKIY